MVTPDEAISRLKTAPWLRDKATQKLFFLLDGEQERTRSVGGIVRDSLMGRRGDKTDIDFATEFLPDEVIARAKGANIAFYPTGIEHGTVTLMIAGRSFEVTSLREDIETDGRHAIVRFGTDWTRDAERRDFTFNALYANMDGTLFDPLDGLHDCLETRVKFIGNPDKRIKEDRLRVYRFFRFSASHCEQNFDEKGLEACKRAAGYLSGISAERIGAEMVRMLGLEQIAKTLGEMSSAGIFALEPSIMERLFALETICDRPEVITRLCLIDAQFEAGELQKKWRLSNAQAKNMKNFSSVAKLLDARRFHEAAYRFGAIAKAAVSFAASYYGWDQTRLDKTGEILASINVPPFPINGRLLLEQGYGSGPALGDMLAKLEATWIKSEFRADREQLLALLK